jgi:HEAT repeat protein
MPLTKHRTPAAPVEASCAELLAALDDSMPAVRCRAALALGAWPEAAGELLARLAGEPDAAVRSALMAALATIGNGAAAAGLARCLGSEDVWLRNAAIETLRALPAQVAPLMSQLLTDPDRDVRILAIGVLDAMQHPDCECWLLHVIEADTDAAVCGAALDVLAGVATSAAAAPVGALLHRFPDEPYLRFAGELALRRARGG